MNVNVRNVLSLLIISTLICAVVISDGADNTRTIDSVPVLPVVTPNDTSVPNATSVPTSTTIPTAIPTVTPTVTLIITPNITSVPNATSIPAPIVTPIITPIVTPTPITSVPTPIITPMITPNITSISNTNVTENETQKIVPEVVILVVPPNVTSVPNTISEKTTESTPTNGAAGVHTDGSGIFGDIYDKIFIAAILGFIGLIYEVVKIKYEHKQKAKTEQLKEDEQDRLLEKLERRQHESSQQATHSLKKQGNLSDTFEEKEDMSKKENKL